jgi:hypothetical protein
VTDHFRIKLEFAPFSPNRAAELFCGRHLALFAMLGYRFICGAN